MQRIIKKRSSFMLMAIFVMAIVSASCSTRQASGGSVSFADLPADGQQTGTFMSMAAPQLGVVIDERVVVLAVEIGSAAETSGIQRGDRLESINDLSLLDSREKVKELIGNFKLDDPPLSLKLERAGKEMTIKVNPFPVAPPTELVRKAQLNNSPLPTPTPVLPPKDYL